MIKAFINPLNHILYSSFYIYALRSVLGCDSVCFDSTPFKCLSVNSLTSKGLLFTIIEHNSYEKRFFIDGDDSFQINEEIYEWCDCYASVNANHVKTPNRDKLVSLAPSFGIQFGSRIQTLRTALLNAVQYWRIVHDSKLKTFLGNYKRLLSRPLYSDMVPKDSKPAYVFFCSTLWYSDDYNKNDREVNARRANFIRACKETKVIEFEGGFVAQKGRSSIDLFSDCLSLSSYPYSQWLQKTKDSAIVFNTPAFWNCHGWKLGEYLALGKAIISTQLSNDLPVPLTHGVNIHFVNSDKDSIKEAINYIIANPDYREQLEKGAKEYWEKYGTPEKSLALMGITKQ